MFNRLKVFLFPASVKGFSYNAVDKDGDGLVQEGTQFERKIDSKVVVTKKKPTVKKAAVKKAPAKKKAVAKKVAKKAPAKKKAAAKKVSKKK
jgi:hypothetical protein